MDYTELDISAILTAIKLSADRHKSQRRKDAESTPYINHPIDVAELLWRVGKVRSTSVIVAALLHDILEDTKTTPDEIADILGEDVLSIVLEVTDDKRLPKEERKRLQIVHAQHLSKEAGQIKIADKICNVRDVVHRPPKDWDMKRRKEYLDWTEKVVDGVRGCNPVLEACYYEILREGRRKLEDG